MIDKRDFAIGIENRLFTIEKKFGSDGLAQVESILEKVENPTDRVLGAILFSVRDGDFEQLEEYVALANEDEMQLRTIASVKFEQVTGRLKT